MNTRAHKRAFNVAEAARYACVGRGTVELWITKRLLPFEELPGQGKGRKKFLRIRRIDMDEFLNKHYKCTSITKKESPVLKGQITFFPRGHGVASKKS